MPSAAERFRRDAWRDVGRGDEWPPNDSGDGEDLVMEVIRCLSDERIRVTDFRTVMPSLEDVFLKITGHSIRD